MKKRIASFLLAALMCLGILSSFTAISAEENTEFEYIFKENFNNLDTIPAKKQIGGLVPLNAYSSMSSVMNGALNLVYYNAGKDQGIMDLQLYDTDFAKVSTDFTLLLTIKPTAAWKDRTDKDFFNFRYSKHPSGTATAWSKLFNIADGRISMTTDNGEVQAPALSMDSYSTLEWMFHTTDTVFTSVDFYVNGEKVGTATLNDVNLTAIDQFRMFAAYDVTAMGTIMIDEYAIIKGTKSHYGVAIPDNAVEVIPPIEAIPEVPADQLTWREYFFYEDFSGESVYSASSPTSAVLAENKGFWLNDGGNTGTYALENGTLVFKGANFLDLQFYINKEYKVKEDFVLSFKFMPMVEGINTEHLVDWRRDSEGGSMDAKNIQILNGCIYADDKNCGKLPVEQWTLVEIAFDYDETLKEFTTYTLLLNGKATVTGQVNPDNILTQIKHFRLFRYMNSESFAVDELCVLAGNTSSIYAMSYGTPEPDNGNDDPSDVVTGEPTVTDPTVTEPTVTDAPATKAPATNEQTAALSTSASTTEAPKTEKTGCGASVVSLGVIAVIALGGMMLRKKED